MPFRELFAKHSARTDSQTKFYPLGNRAGGQRNETHYWRKKMENDIKAILLVYDIPQGTGIANPSYILRGYGFRINLSAWIIPQSKIPYFLIERMRAKGCSVETVRFDERDTNQIRALGRSALTGEIKRIRRSLDESVTKLQAKVANMDVDGERVLYYSEGARDYAEASLRRAKVALRKAEEASLAFDITADVKDLFESVQEHLKAKSEIIFGHLARMEEKNMFARFGVS